ncbi:MAG TPA: glycosyltransferase [Pseudonocardia sp.]|uniref:glycosyltransferase n=1 Tax=Pseudonocardia sp. TaxID=60912 RepID=UPI002EDA3C23
MRILFTCVPHPGHLLPVLPLARAFRGRGDDVAVLVPASFAPVLSDEDLEVLVAGVDMGMVVAELARRGGTDPVGAAPQADEMEAFARAVTLDIEVEVFAGARVDLSIEDSVLASREWQPDLVVHDSYDYVGPLVAAALDVPSALVTLGPEMSPAFTQAASAKVAARYEARGLAWRPAAWVLDICPTALQRDEWQAPGGWLPLRPEAYRAPDGASRREAQPLTGQPRILVTFGTTFTSPQVVGPVLGDLSAKGAGLRMTLGLTGSAEDYEVEHGSVMFEGFLPLRQLLADIDLVVTNAGAGTVLGALAEGIPIVALPQGADQFLHADRAVAAGAAIQVLPPAFTPDAVTAAVSTALGQPSFRENALRVAKEIAAMPAPGEVAATLASTLNSP